MINDCFRHQHPEAYGREPVAGAVVPLELRYGRDPMYVTMTAELPEETMGNPEAASLDDGPGGDSCSRSIRVTRRASSYR
ncbi:MAG TPA: hypothetical protein VFO18_14990 [Methylomirabilota bacterium]|nr:hypothetical protein [Methylomirabilota bacterium]